MMIHQTIMRQDFARNAAMYNPVPDDLESQSKQGFQPASLAYGTTFVPWATPDPKTLLIGLPGRYEPVLHTRVPALLTVKNGKPELILVPYRGDLTDRRQGILHPLQKAHLAHQNINGLPMDKIQPFIDETHTYLLEKGVSVTEPGEHDCVSSYCSFFHPSAGNIIDNLLIAVRKIPDEHRVAIKDQIQQWQQDHLDPTFTERLNTLIEKIPTIPFRWARDIAQDARLHQWFSRYPDALIQVIDSSISGYPNRLRIHKKIERQIKNFRETIKPQIFEMIQQGLPDHPILKKIYGNLPPAECKALASRDKHWHNLAEEILITQFPQYRDRPVQWLHRYTCFGPEFNHLQARNARRVYNRKNLRCLDYRTGKPLDPKAYMKNFLLSVRINPHNQALIETENPVHRHAIIRDPENLHRICKSLDDAITLTHELAHALAFLKDKDIIQRKPHLTAAQAFHLAETWRTGLGQELVEVYETASQSKVIGQHPAVRWESPHISDPRWTFRNLTSPEQLNREASEMKNCVGMYVSRAIDLNNPSHLYSLYSVRRDSRYTLELRQQGETYQIKALLGAINLDPLDEDRKEIQMIIDKLRISPEERESHRESRQQARANHSAREKLPRSALRAGKQAVQRLLWHRLPKLRKALSWSHE